MSALLRYACVWSFVLEFGVPTACNTIEQSVASIERSSCGLAIAEIEALGVE